MAMLEPYLRLMPSAGPAALTAVAQALKGEVPAPAAKLASALTASDSECEGSGALGGRSLVCFLSASPSFRNTRHEFGRIQSRFGRPQPNLGRCSPSNSSTPP